MPTRHVEIKGLDELTKKIDSITSLSAFNTGLKKGAYLIKGKIAKYPKHTSANQPPISGPGSWYVRGTGTKYRSVDGKIKTYRTSETLGRRWTVAQQVGRALTWIVGNNVSYGRFVQSNADQAHFHRKRKWRTIETIARAYSKHVLELVKRNVDLALEK